MVVMATNVVYALFLGQKHAGFQRKCCSRGSRKYWGLVSSLNSNGDTLSVIHDAVEV